MENQNSKKSNKNALIINCLLLTLIFLILVICLNSNDCSNNHTEIVKYSTTPSADNTPNYVFIVAYPNSGEQLVKEILIKSENSQLETGPYPFHMIKSKTVFINNYNNNQFLTDKNFMQSLIKTTVNNQNTKFKILHLIRNGIDTTFAYLTQEKIHINWANFSKYLTLWNEFNELVHNECKELGQSQCQSFKYEDLVLKAHKLENLMRYSSMNPTPNSNLFEEILETYRSSLSRPKLLVQFADKFEKEIGREAQNLTMLNIQSLELENSIHLNDINRHVNIVSGIRESNLKILFFVYCILIVFSIFLSD
jgi:hypothetical protein